MSATKDLKQDHLTLKRVRDIAQRSSERLYSGENIPIEDIEIISVVIEEFVDRFHHGKEEQAYFPEANDKNGFSEDIRKFLIEDELGRRIAKCFLRELKAWKDRADSDGGIDSSEPVARFLKRHMQIFTADDTGKKDRFFDLIEEKGAAYQKKKIKC